MEKEEEAELRYWAREAQEKIDEVFDKPLGEVTLRDLYALEKYIGHMYDLIGVGDE